ncbi:MAG: VWA domain-containing protein [Thiotrichales bacterium]
MNLAFSEPWFLLLLTSVLLPWLSRGQPSVKVADLTLLPSDAISRWGHRAVRMLGSTALALIALALAGPYVPEQTEEKTGKGAQIILLLDRSRSMDEPFHSAQRDAVPALAQPTLRQDTKGHVARRVLSEFVAARNNDRFGLVVFSTYAIPVLPLTGKQPIVQAAIAAGNVGRGLAETDIGAGIERALDYFRDQPYTGSRVIVLISDGAGDLTLGAKQRIEDQLQRHRVALYWIFIRSRNTRAIDAESDATDLAPHQALHRFFESANAPYRVYTAENPEDLRRAVQDVGRLQNLPVLYDDVIPRAELHRPLIALSMILVTLVLLARGLELSAWR